MKFAYLILAHKNPQQLKRLVDALNTEYSVFIIHIDAKQKIWSFTRIFYDYLPGKVFFCPKRKNVRWGGYSMIEATMAMLDFFFKLKLKANYFHLLSGQDYPIKSNKEIRSFFKKNIGINFIEYFSLPNTKWNPSIERLTLRWWLNNKQVWWYSDLDFYKENKHNFKNKKNDLKPYGGSQWWSLHRECIKYIHNLYHINNDLFESFRYSFIPDELLFQTLILNSRFKLSVRNKNLRFIQWSEDQAHPDVITSDYFDQINNCKNKFFARKFDNSSAILDLIDERNNMGE